MTMHASSGLSGVGTYLSGPGLPLPNWKLSQRLSSGEDSLKWPLPLLHVHRHSNTN